jgi:hypothetical protein
LFHIVFYIPLSSYNRKMKEQKTCPCVGKHMYLNIENTMYMSHMKVLSTLETN